MMLVALKPNRTVENEIPIGAIDNINTSFTTAFNFEPGSLCVFLNGLKLDSGVADDFIETGPNTFALNIAPLTNDIVMVNYKKS
jgi:hypothetical protein